MQKERSPSHPCFGPGPSAFIGTFFSEHADLLRELLRSDADVSFRVPQRTLRECRRHLASPDGVLVTVEHHLCAWGSSRDVHGLVPIPPFDICFWAVDGLNSGGRTEG
jgi:hypothetical protein